MDKLYDCDVTVGNDQTYIGSEFDETFRDENIMYEDVLLYHVYLVKELYKDPQVINYCECINVIVHPVDELPVHSAKKENSLYVIGTFENINKSNVTNLRIMGRTAFIELVKQCQEHKDLKKLFNNIERPLYCNALNGAFICFTGFKEEHKEELTTMKRLINFMGGKTHRELDPKLTHLISKVCYGTKYKYAASFNVPIVSESWIHDAWNNRETIDFNACETNFVSKHKLKIFRGAKVNFMGFSDDEKSEMIQVLEDNGGESVDDTNLRCTHIVIDETKVIQIPNIKSRKAKIVKAEWFWSSIQYEFCQEGNNPFSTEVDASASQSTIGSPIYTSVQRTPTSNGKGNKRKKTSTHSNAKRKSSHNNTRQSEGSFSADSTFSSPVLNENAEKMKLTKRWYKFDELRQTETNYVGILRTIMTLFKDELEAMTETNEELLDVTEIKIIFGNLPPIYETHERMLADLNELHRNWSENSSVGEVMLKYSKDLEKSYPPFINFYEHSLGMLEKCDKSKPRFHAFLKLRQSKPECGREKLQDLLIRPVQRLPRVNLLLNAIFRSTPNESIDFSKLEEAIVEIQKVVNHINEDKRRTEGQVVLFEIFNDIDNCPPDLVSSNRCFINRCEVKSLNKEFGNKKKDLILILFSDMIEVCKKLKPNKDGTINSSKSYHKSYKHKKLICLSDVREVVSFKNTVEFQLITKDYLSYHFTIIDNTDKTNYLQSILKQIANTVCTPNMENYLTEVEYQTVPEEDNSGPWSSIMSFASETGKKVVNRVRSIKTPNKPLLPLQRSNSMMSAVSPLFRGQNGMSPSSRLATKLQMAVFSPLSNENSSPSGISASSQIIRKKSAKLIANIANTLQR